MIRRFSWPWKWQDPYAIPLYATGAEYSTTEKAWKQGTGEGLNIPSEIHKQDVPTFFTHAWSVVNDPEYSSLSDQDQMEHVFSPDALKAMSRHCTLNLRRVQYYSDVPDSFGTLEVRQMHSTLDENFSVHWALFCVNFVEAFKDSPEPYILAPTAAEGLKALQMAQEVATLRGLEESMGLYASPALFEILLSSGRARAE